MKHLRRFGLGIVVTLGAGLVLTALVGIVYLLQTQEVARWFICTPVVLGFIYMFGCLASTDF